VLPEDAAASPSGVRELRVGGGGMVDLHRLVAGLAGKVVAAEGGPTLAGRMIALGVVDELFLTVSPVLAGRADATARLGLVEGVELVPETRVAGRLRSVRANGSHLFLRYDLR